jgi:hypothetical protein
MKFLYKMLPQLQDQKAIRAAYRNYGFITTATVETVKLPEIYSSGTNPFEKKNDGRDFKYYILEFGHSSIKGRLNPCKNKPKSSAKAYRILAQEMQYQYALFLPLLDSSLRLRYSLLLVLGGWSWE